MKSRRQSSAAAGEGTTHSSGGGSGGCKMERKDVEKNRRLHMKGLCLKLSSLIPPSAAKHASLLSAAAPSSCSNPNKARKALRALRSLVKIQALVRGYLVRKQTAMTLRRLQTLVRLQADSIAVKKASYRKSMEQVRISDQEVRLKPPATPVHRRRLSDSTDSNYERSPRIVEMDTCHLRSRSSRMAGCYTLDPSAEHRPAALAPASCSPLPGKLQPARISFRRSSHDHERDPRGSKTAHNTPRFASAQPYDSPAKSVIEYGYGTSTPRRTPHRDALVSPRYMAGTASSAARTRCHSAPRQRQQTSAEASRTSLARAGSRRSCPHAHGGFCSQCSNASRRAGCSDLSVDDETAARDYYLDTLW